MVTRQGQVKILDFGLARLAWERSGGSSQTQVGAFMGTPEYVAPEQAADAHKADIRADIYSLGCTLYFLLSGRPPFKEGTLVKVVLAHIETEAPPLHEVRPEVPEALSAVVGKMMAKDPVARFQTPAEVAKALEPFCRSQPHQEDSNVPGARQQGKITAGRPDPLSVVKNGPAGPRIAEPLAARPAPGGDKEWDDLVIPDEPPQPRRKTVRAASAPWDGDWWRRLRVLAAAGAALVLLLLGIILVIKYKGPDGTTKELSIELREIANAGKTTPVRTNGDPGTKRDGLQAEKTVDLLKYLLPFTRRYCHGSGSRSCCPDSSYCEHLPMGPTTPTLHGRYRCFSPPGTTKGPTPLRLGSRYPPQSLA